MTPNHSPPSATLRGDIVAGVTTAAVVIPKCMAYAAIAGVPAEAGLYAAIVPMGVYALLGSSRVLSMSTTSAIAILSAAALAQAVPGGTPEQLMSAAATLAMLTGAILVAASVLRLGFLANFISDPVLTGFKAGLGCVIIVDQLPKLLGFHIDKGGFFQNIASVVSHLPATSIATLVLAVLTLALVFGLERFAPRVPAPLLAVILGIGVAAFLGAQSLGIETVGAVRAGLPRVALPGLALVPMLWPAALGIALMSFTETIATGRTFTPRGQQRPKPDRELLALGAANLLGSAFRALPAGGGTSQTAVNARAGAASKVAGAITALLALATVLVLAPVIALLPQATLAAVVVATTLGLVNPAEFRAIRAVRQMEFRWAVIALVGVLLLGALLGILIAVAVSVLVLVYHANRPAVYVLARDRAAQVFRSASTQDNDETFAGLLMVRTEGRIHFANAQRVGDVIWPLVHAARPQVLLLDCGAVPDVEYTALQMLDDAESRLRAEGCQLWLCSVSPEFTRVLKRTSLGERLAAGRLFPGPEQAVRAWQARSETSAAEPHLP